MLGKSCGAYVFLIVDLEGEAKAISGSPRIRPMLKQALDLPFLRRLRFLPADLEDKAKAISGSPRIRQLPTKLTAILWRLRPFC
jgi:hypothetical protein